MGGLHNTSALDLPTTLVTNTALNNTLVAGSFYFTSGQLIAPNDGSSPSLNYINEGLLPLPSIATANINTSNTGFVVGLGQVAVYRAIS